jgi:glycosyltransferase involved in cell wall biosynthesis
MVSLEITLPVLNEEKALNGAVEKLRDFLFKHLPQYQCWINIVDNGSTDRTLSVAKELSRIYPDQVSYLHLGIRGRGRALKTAWLQSHCEVLSYMDIDLSTGLEAYPILISSIVEGGYDIATGNRLMEGAQTKRSFKREFISRIYNLLIRIIFRVHFSDAQCGFKAISRFAAHTLIPLIQDNEWFFDSELLLIAEKNGFRIKDVPIRWTEDEDSRVKIMQAAMGDLRGLTRLRVKGVPRVSSPRI